MTEDELRSLVRAAIARHIGSGAQPAVTTASVHQHASHLRLAVRSGEDLDGPCLIEPAVRCSHCGYCQSLGH